MTHTVRGSVGARICKDLAKKRRGQLVRLNLEAKRDRMPELYILAVDQAPGYGRIHLDAVALPFKAQR